MKTTGSIVAFAASAAAQQFVLYANGDVSASQRADPIISPGDLSGHVHDFLGAGSFEPELSYEALQDTDCTTVGAADGSGNSQDNSVYWHPAMYAKKNDGSGYMKVPTVSHKMYYRKPAAKKYAEPFEFPEGFRMITGNPFMRAANTDSSTNSQDITSWTCFGEGYKGEDGGFPSQMGHCATYPGFMGTLHFPHCWNGEEFNQDDPMAHMAYPEGNIESGDCPSSHPTALPHIFMENNFEINEIFDQIDVSSIVLAQGDETGYGWHADFFNGWKSGALPELFDTCPQGEYGNHDVGVCPSYKPYTKSPADCKLKNYYKENVETPGSSLVGCNPISDVNPAPQLAVAKLGSSTTSCGAGSSSGGDDDEEPAPASSSAPAPSASYSSAPEAPAYSSATSAAMSILPDTTSYDLPTSYAAPTTTFATATSAAQPSQTWGGDDWGSWNQGNTVDTAAVEEEDEEDVVYVTEWVTATAEATATAYAKRDVHRHNHMHAHKRRHF